MDPFKQTKLYGLDNHFNELKFLYDNKKLPNKILLSGKKGNGKFTLSLHFINYVLSLNEDYSYDFKNLRINEENRSFKLISNHSSPNLYLIDILKDKKNIEINQIRKLVDFCNKSSFNDGPRFILVNNLEFMNLNSSNALLKKLEEPNDNIFFILINNSQKILSTIKSRCLNFNIVLSEKKVKDVFSKITNQTIDDLFNKDLISYYFTIGDFINLYNFSLENNIDLSSITLKDFLFKIIDENHYKKETLNINLIYTFVQMYFLKNIKIKNNYELYSKFLNTVENIERFNLDLESLFIQFRHQIKND